MTGHLTSQQVTEYRSGVSDPTELLRLDDHITGCAECRSLLAQAADPASATRLLRIDFSSPHLTEAQLDDYAASRSMPSDLMQHLDLCPECRAEADSLRQSAGAGAQLPTKPTTPVWMGSLAAAMAILALGVAAWWVIRSHPAAAPTRPVETVSKIPPQYQAEVRTAIDSGVLHIPASVTGMSGGATQLPAFHLISPTSTAVIDDTPTFRWTPLDGAAYSISVFDDHFHEIAGANGLRVTEWRPDKPFPRGAAYLWEVRAVQGAHIERAPTATEPEARFAILSPADAQNLDAAFAAMPDEPLALGIICADAGALADAKTEFEHALSTKDESAAEKFLHLLK